MADVKWIKITTDIFDDEKILLIETMPDAYAIIVCWFKLLCLAGKMNNAGVFKMNERIAYNAKMLATIFRMKESTVTLALQTFEEFGMIETIDDVITIPNWGKHQSLDRVEKYNDYHKKYMRHYREKQKMLCDVNGDVNSAINSKVNVNQIEREKNKNKNKSINTSINTSNVHPPTANAQFEQAWTLYPRKKGKGQVTERAKKELCKHTIEEIERAIGRYLKDLEKEPWRQVQNGSTFFNSGIVDYYDDTYTEDEPIKAADKAAKQWADDWSFVFEEANREENSENSS